MTRQNLSRGLREVVTMPCPRCGEGGRVISEDTALIEVERRIRRLALASAVPGLRIEVHPQIATRLLGGRNSLLRRLEEETGHRVELLNADGASPMDHCAIVPD
jgi:Ribonuclease G/E